MSDLLSELEAESQVLKLPSDDQMRRVAGLANEMIRLEEEMEELDRRIDLKRERVNELSLKLIPDLMSEIGLTEFKLTDKSELSVNPFYSANISEDNREAAHQWLRDNEFGGLIKNEFKVSLGKGDDEQATKLETLLAEQELDFERKEGVHASTLKAFVKEQTEGGVTLPDVLGVFVGRVAKITKPKVKKEKAKK